VGRSEAAGEFSSTQAKQSFEDRDIPKLELWNEGPIESAKPFRNAPN